MKRYEGKPGPNRSSIIKGAVVLLGYGHFKWSKADGFVMDGHTSIRFETWLSDAQKDGLITRGKWQKKTWIGYACLSRLVRAFLTRAIERGTLSWDVIIAKCLSTVLVGALGARSGDVGQSQMYKGDEYLQFSHIQLDVKGDEPVFANLEMHITLKYTKGFKNARNEDTDAYLRPLNDVHNSHMCPIALLLVHCLRHGLVAGTTLQDVLDRAVRRSDRTVEWLYPDRPVLTAFAIGPLRCDLDKAARPAQMCDSIRDMALAAGMVDRAYTHALRCGAARDVAHLPASVTDGTGLATESVRRFLGHTHKSTTAGTTDAYLGGPSTQLYNARAERATMTKGREPRFATAEGIEARGTTDKFLTQPTPLPPRVPLTPKSVNAPLATSPMPATPTPVPRDVNIDPALLDDAELAAMAASLPEEAVREIFSTIMPTNDTGGGDAEPDVDDHISLERVTARDIDAALAVSATPQGAEEDALLLGPCGDVTATAATPEDFVATYAAYNVVDNYTLAKAYEDPQGKDMDAMLAKCAVVGGSRDAPTPMIHSCHTTSCIFTSFTRSVLQRHEECCTEDRAMQMAADLVVVASGGGQQFACPYDTCAFVPAPSSQQPSHSLGKHVREVHKFDAKPCPHDGCDPAKLYYAQDKYRYHLTHKHSGRWPAPCTFPGCTDDKTYSGHNTLTRHLKNAHGLTAGESAAPYMPALTKQVWVARQCPLDNCETEWTTRRKARDHVRRTHKYSAEDADTLMDAQAQYDTVVASPIVRKQKAPTFAAVKHALELQGEPAHQPRKRVKASTSAPA